jgi:hypothetical protein
MKTHPIRRLVKALWQMSKRWRGTIVVMLLVLPPGVTMLVVLPKQTPRVLTFSGPKPSPEEMAVARKEAIDRSTSFEQLLVALGSFELGIVAYVAGVVFGKDARIGHPRLFFSLFTSLTFITTVTYLHTFRIYLGYGAYAVQLEMAGMEASLRPTTRVFTWSSSPNVPPILSPVVALAGSLEIVSLFPVFILTTAIIAFGRRLQVEWDWVVSLALLCFGWAFLYAFPSMIEFILLVRAANAAP